MKQRISIKRISAFSLALFLIASLPIPTNHFFGNPTIAKASTIEDDQNNVKINIKNKSLVKDTSYTLKIYNLSDGQKVSYKSKDSSIASVNKDGEITGNGLGTTIIFVTVKGGSKKSVSFECNVTVGPPAISVALTKRELTITQGKKRSLKAILKPNNTVEEVFYTSSDTSIATVDFSGRVSAVSSGEAIITAYINTQLKDACIISVTTEIIDSED